MLTDTWTSFMPILTGLHNSSIVSMLRYGTKVPPFDCLRYLVTRSSTAHARSFAPSEVLCGLMTTVRCNQTSQPRVRPPWRSAQPANPECKTHAAFWKLDREETASSCVWNTNFNRDGSCKTAAQDSGRLIL